MKRFFQLVLMSLVLVLAGCAASVQRGETASAAMQVPPAAAKKVVFSVVGSSEMMAANGWGELVQEWQNCMAWAADNAKIAHSFQAGSARPPAEPATWVQIKVNDFRFVSTAKRWGMGVFTGNAFIDADVSFTDLQADRELGVRKYASSSSFLHGVFAAMTERQLEAISTEIVKEVAGR
jgi:hypothetical protein